MSGKNMASRLLACIDSQPMNIKKMLVSERDSLIISAIRVDEQWVILSRYGDDIWQLEGFTSNTLKSRTRMDFNCVPTPFRAVMKALIYCYLRRGREGQRRPKGATLQSFFSCMQPFLRHLESLKVVRFSAVNPMICASYVATCKAHRQRKRSQGEPLSQGCLVGRFTALEALYELSQYTDDPVPQHPWPDNSAWALAGLTGSDAYRVQSHKTPLMPDQVFCTLFEKAVEQVQRGKALLDLRDDLAAITLKLKGRYRRTIEIVKNQHLATHGFDGGLTAFHMSITNLRTACYVVLASTSGCRNHELANLQSGAHHRTEDDQGTSYHWMRSKSEKTDAGVRDWMIPSVSVQTLRLMERWAEPFQNLITAEITERRRVNPYDPEITNAQRHNHALFIGECPCKANQVRTLSSSAWTKLLKTFARDSGLDWNLATHQFRRKFANYVAHSRFGDLRYLREHFAHRSLDMMLGYAMDQDWGLHLDVELYDDIQLELEDIKLGVVDKWMGDEPLGGGYGRSIKHWHRAPANLAIFKSHAAMVASIAESTSIRSNGHAWCTADDNSCIGNTIERTRCGDCDNAVIGIGHAGVYQQLYDNLKELLDCDGIGDGGRQRVLRDMGRCHDVLAQLGYDAETNAV